MRNEEGSQGVTGHHQPHLPTLLETQSPVLEAYKALLKDCLSGELGKPTHFPEGGKDGFLEPGIPTLILTLSPHPNIAQHSALCYDVISMEQLSMNSKMGYFYRLLKVGWEPYH